MRKEERTMKNQTKEKSASTLWRLLFKLFKNTKKLINRILIRTLNSKTWRKHLINLSVIKKNINLIFEIQDNYSYKKCSLYWLFAKNCISAMNHQAINPSRI